MKALVTISKVVVLATLLTWLVPALLLARVEPNQIGVRTSATSGVDTSDLGPGWHFAVPGLHKLQTLPSSYFMLDFTDDEMGPQKPLVIRTKDNNTVTIDVSVPVRIKPGEAHELVAAGNHAQNADGSYRYMQLAEETATSVLREQLAVLDSVGYYSTERRLAATPAATNNLHEQLATLHLEAQAVLLRAVTFRDEYEKQLQTIQLNEQNKLFDAAAKILAAKQQELDNYVQGTSAQVSQRAQEWLKRQAELERAYQVGLLDIGNGSAQITRLQDLSDKPGAARARLAAMAPADVGTLRTRAAKIFNLDPESVGDEYLIGINNIAAETLEYKNRVSAGADATESRLTAEGNAMVAKVQGAYESNLNALLSSPGGKAYIAWQAADNVKFGETLSFSSSEGIPSVLRLRQFAELFMGAR